MSVLLTVAGILAQSGSSDGGGSGVGGILDGLEGLFDSIKCWGSTWDAGKAKSFTESIASEYENKLNTILVDLNENSVNDINSFLYDLAIEYKGEKSWYLKGNANGCTRDALNGMIPALDSITQKFEYVIKEAYKQKGYEITLKKIEIEHYWDGKLDGKWKVNQLDKVNKTSIFSGGTSEASLWWLLLLPAGWYGGLKLFSNDKKRKRKFK